MKQLNWMVVHALLNIGFFPKKKKNFTPEQDALRRKQWIVLPQRTFYRVVA